MVDSCAVCDSQRLGWWPRRYTGTLWLSDTLNQPALSFVLLPLKLFEAHDDLIRQQRIRIHHCDFMFFRWLLIPPNPTQPGLMWALISGLFSSLLFCTTYVPASSSWRGGYSQCCSGSTFQRERGEICLSHLISLSTPLHALFVSRSLTSCGPNKFSQCHFISSTELFLPIAPIFSLCPICMFLNKTCPILPYL